LVGLQKLDINRFLARGEPRGRRAKCVAASNRFLARGEPRGRRAKCVAASKQFLQ